jgi:hypothetical protein
MFEESHWSPGSGFSEDKGNIKACFCCLEFSCSCGMLLPLQDPPASSKEASQSGRERRFEVISQPAFNGPFISYMYL